MELESRVENGSFIIVLPERVNESNVPSIKTQILALLNIHPNTKPVIDCSHLKYISSSGLRVLLTVQKRVGKDKIELRDVSKEVNEILEMTGFVDIFHVVRPIKKVNLANCLKLGDCINGVLYRLGIGVMVKAFQKGITREEVETEIELAKKALINGIPTPISFKVVKCVFDETEGEEAPETFANEKESLWGIIFEEIEPVSIAQKIAYNPMNLGLYAVKYADFIKELHKTPVKPGTLPSIKTRYQEWLGEAEKLLAPEKVAGMKEMVNRLSDNMTFVHGDPSINNVYIVDDELMIMDLASCGYGHPVFDLQSIYASLVAIELDNPGYCKEKLGLEPKTCRQIWRLFIKRYLEDEDGNPADEGKSRMLNQLLEQYYILKEELVDGIAEINSINLDIYG